MNLLPDTHTLLWSLKEDPRLSKKIRVLLDDEATNKFVSAVTFWEIAIKVDIGHLKIDFPISQLPLLVAENGSAVIDVSSVHALGVASLPFHHKDPFDRLLIAQAKTEGLTIATKDANIIL